MCTIISCAPFTPLQVLLVLPPRVGAEGFAADHRGQPAALAAAGIHLPLLEVDGGGGGDGQALGAEERALVAAAAAAEVAADGELRGALVEGLCLFVSGALLAAQPGAAVPAGSEAQLAQVLEVLRGKVQHRAEAAAAGAAALLATRVAPPAGEDGEEEDEEMSAARKGEPQGVLVPLAELTWGDEAPHGGGALPTALPAELLQFPSCRGMQVQLLALQDAQLAGAQLQLLAHGGPLHLLAGASVAGNALPALQRMAAALASSAGGASSAADAAVYQLLAWLLDAQQGGGDGGHGAAEWQQLLQRSLAAEAWFRWQNGLWSSAATALPQAHAAATPAAGQQRWAATAGPLRLHIAAGTVLATAVIAAPTTLIADRSARLLQLKLAARQLRAAASQPAAAAAAAAAEWQAAAAVAAATLSAHLPSLPHPQQLEAALSWLAGDRWAVPAVQRSQQDAALLQLAGEALSTSSHPVLQELLHPVLLPALQGLLEGSNAAAQTCPEGELHQGDGPHGHRCRMSCRQGLPASCAGSPPVCSLPVAHPLQTAWQRAAACGRCWAWRGCTCCWPPRGPTRQPSTGWCACTR